MSPRTRITSIKTFIDTLQQVIGDDKKVGIESSLSIALQKEIPGRRVVCDLIDKARLIKTDYEIGRIAYASKVTNIGMKKALALAQPGPHIATIYSEGTKEMMVTMLFEIPDVNLLMCKFTAAVWPKALSAQPHSIPGLFDELDEGGPNVAIVTAQTNGYSAELERTFFLGSVKASAVSVTPTRCWLPTTAAFR